MRNNIILPAARLRVIALLTAIAVPALIGDAAAQFYPKRALQLHVALDTDGNAANRIAAVMRAPLQDSLTVQVLKSNAGAAGYQLMLASADSHLMPAVVIDGSAPTGLPLLGVIASSPMLCVVNANTGVKSMADWVARVERDNKLRVSSAGKSSHSHLTAQLVMRAAGVSTRVNQLALKSPAAALAAVLKGTAQFTCVAAALATPLVKRRQLNALIATSPGAGVDVPTAKAMGFDGFEVLDSFFAIAASERVKADVVNTWQSALTQLSQNKTFLAEATELGFRVGREPLMLRSQANAVLAKKQAALPALMARYGVERPER
jgi:tripartite-type tricarboxylate transporter receptor subunit TctC